MDKPIGQAKWTSRLNEPIERAKWQAKKTSQMDKPSEQLEWPLAGRSFRANTTLNTIGLVRLVSVRGCVLKKLKPLQLVNKVKLKIVHNRILKKIKIYSSSFCF